MFTGIIEEKGDVIFVESRSSVMHYGIRFPHSLLHDLKIGASVAVDGVCQTVVKIEGENVFFDAIEETLLKTTLDRLFVGRSLHLERAAKFGDEIGGHLLSGHVYTKATILNLMPLRIALPPACIKYLFPKGFVAVDGASLTVCDVDLQKAIFTIHLIPETLLKTTLGGKKVGDEVNIELDFQTQAIVDTIERYFLQKKS